MRRLSVALFAALFATLVSSTAFAQIGITFFPGPGSPASSGGGCSQATNVLGRAAFSGIDGTHTTAYTNLICGLVTDGVISGTMSGSGSGASACGSKLDGLYILATQNSTMALVNLCSTSYSLSTVNTPVFTADKGYQAGSSGDALDTNFNATTATSPNLTQNSDHHSVWNNTNTTDTLAAMGSGGSTTSDQIYPKFTDNNFYSRLNDSSASAGYAITNPIGFLVGNRSASNAIQAYQNGSSLGTGTQASGSQNNATITILRQNGATSTTAFQIGAASFGASLSSTDVTHFNSRICTYMKAVSNAAGLC